MPLRYERVTDVGGARELYGVEEASVPVDHPGLLPESVDDLAGLLPDGTPPSASKFELVSMATTSSAHLREFPLKTHPHGQRQRHREARGAATGRRPPRGYATVERVRAEGRKVVVTFVVRADRHDRAR